MSWDEWEGNNEYMREMRERRKDAGYDKWDVISKRFGLEEIEDGKRRNGIIYWKRGELEGYYGAQQKVIRFKGEKNWRKALLPDLKKLFQEIDKNKTW